MKNTFSDEHFKKSNHAPRWAHDLISGEKPNSCPAPPQPWVGDGGGDGDDGRIFSEHPSPILHAPRDIISRRGPAGGPPVDPKANSPGARPWTPRLTRRGPAADPQANLPGARPGPPD